MWHRLKSLGITIYSYKSKFVKVHLLVFTENAEIRDISTANIFHCHSCATAYCD
jgi:hypothetical protein